MKIRGLHMVFMVLVLMGCEEKQEEQDPGSMGGEKIVPEFATGFEIEEFEDFKRVVVKSPFQGALNKETYYLVPHGSDLLESLAGKKVIEVPVKTIVCTSTTHIPLIDYLDVEDALIGFPTLDYVSSSSVRDRIDEGKVTDLGTQINLNLEMLISLQPDLVMGYTLNGDLTQLGKVEQSGIPVILNSEYLEEHPLGRAEWIKFLAVFFNKMPQADSVFNNIKSEYLAVQNQLEEVVDPPSVLSGVVYGDTWFLPGGRNYASRIISDAAGNYLWSDDSTSGYLELGFEAVYSHASEADFWIGVASYNTLDELSGGDSRYSNFKPYKSGNIYTYTKRVNETGGNEYLELGYLRPDIILKDLACIFHPGIIDDHELYFYQKLK